MIFRCIPPDWLKEEKGLRPREGEFSEEQRKKLNEQGYNIYFFPNCPSTFEPGVPVKGDKIDTFQWLFVDMDLKEGVYKDKEEFLEVVSEFPLSPTLINDSGNGIHVYWETTDLDAMSYVRLQRRLCRYLKTDEAVGKIAQLMRVPGSYNTKEKDNWKLCQVLLEDDTSYVCEDFDKILPPLSPDDEKYCINHYNQTYNIKDKDDEVDLRIPPKFTKLIRDNKEVRSIWTTVSEDRSSADFRLAHLMFAHGFTKDEAMSVLVHSYKAVERRPAHRISYAQNIVEKIWTFENSDNTQLSKSVADILAQYDKSSIKGARFPCWTYLDNTEHGFRLGQVIGLVAGSGVGKTAIALNMFMGFVQNNPDKVHFFIPLEQPANEIAERWKNLCGDNTQLHSKVHVMSNYDDNGGFRALSFDDIKEYLLKFKKDNNVEIGCVVIDHIGALKKKTKDGENQGLMDICHSMKSFAVETNTLLVMQSQAPREKAGSGDLELDKDAAYGTVYFEAYCDYLITLWQPLKRCYRQENCPSVTAFKFCKIRHKNIKKDKIQEDTRYALLFDPDTGRLREMTEDEEESFNYFNNQAVNIRKKDRKTDLLEYVTIRWENDKQENASVSKDLQPDKE